MYGCYVEASPKVIRDLLRKAAKKFQLRSPRSLSEASLGKHGYDDTLTSCDVKYLIRDRISRTEEIAAEPSVDPMPPSRKHPVTDSTKKQQEQNCGLEELDCKGIFQG